jgi:hypothetical protein
MTAARTDGILAVKHRRLRLMCLIALLALLAACGPKRYTGDSPYRPWLVGGETVLAVVNDGPFTLLHIDYRSGGSFLTSAHLTYYRVIYRNRILVKQADRAGHWDSATSPAFFVEIFGPSDYALHVAHEEAGKPVLQHIAAADPGWRQEKGHAYGYRLSANVRYFPPSHPRGNGFLLHAAPFAVQTLPPIASQNGYGPSIQNLASIAPDGKSVAYVDGFVPPEIIMVSEDDGVIHDPIPIPLANMSAQEDGLNAVDRVMRWFPTAFAWKRNSLGKWGLEQRAEAERVANPVEALFLDAGIGYRTCFASTNTSCLKNWRQFTVPGEAPAYAYVPDKLVQAFGANVRRLHASLQGRANYAVILDAPADKVTAALIDRLKARNIPFVRSDQCPRAELEGWLDCAAPLHELLHWQAPVDDEMMQLVVTKLEAPAVFILPTLAVAVQAHADGGSWIQTVARYHPERQREKQ